MRLIFSFLLGFFIFFYIGELLTKIFKRPAHNFIGMAIVISGFFMGFWGRMFIDTPWDVLSAVFLIGSGLGLIMHHLLSRRYLISEKRELKFIRSHESFIDRLLEIVPGALTWTALTSPFWLSFTLPFAVAYLIILADIYWLLNAIKISVAIFVGYKKLVWANKQPWLQILKKDYPDQWEEYYHLFLLPTYKEGIEILAPAFDAIAQLNYPKEKVMLAVGFEERAPKEITDSTIEHLEKYKKKIGHIFTSIHPYKLEGEVPGPATNRNWMMNNAIKELKKLGIPQDKVIVTTLDADFVVHKEFLAGMLHKYLSMPEDLRDKRSYTGSFLYYNNYWESPTAMRLINAGTAFWQLAEMVSSDKYQNFSSMSINMKSLVDIGMWIPDKVNDDSGFYWKAYFHFRGDYKVVPHFLLISGDTTNDVSLYKAFKNQYLQLKRWAYGVEHIPFVIKEYFRNPDIPFWDKTDKVRFVIWANLKWTTLALFVTFGGLIIPFINPQYKESVVAINLPIVSSWILTAAFLGMLSTIYVHEKTVPPRPKNWSLLQRIWSYLQWLLIPVALVTISTLPAIDAQTSLMLGRYLEYRVTTKVRADKSAPVDN